MPQNRPDIFSNQPISAETFLQQYWQKQPYLFRQTCLPTGLLPSTETLFELAAQPEVQSRIVYSQDGAHYAVVHDEPEAWDELQQMHPTLLVSDIEKWYPPARQLLQWLPFIKSWRFDGLMLSFAPEGASVGAHLDHYDVFLFQVRGSRRWDYDLEPELQPRLLGDSELAVLQDYQPQTTAVLQPGDILYLPPQHPHHGISASDDCVTCSIGLRAPSHAELLLAVAESLAADTDPAHRLKDQQTTLQARADIGAAEIALLRQLLHGAASASDAQLASALGSHLSQYRSLETLPEPADDLPVHPLQDTPEQWWHFSPFYTAVSYDLDCGETLIFVDGEKFRCQQELGQRLASQQPFQLQGLVLDETEQRCLEQWILDGILEKAESAV